MPVRSLHDVVYGPNTGPSGRALARSLPPMSHGPLINWTGRSWGPDSMGLNSNATSNKLEQLRLFKDAGLPVPEFSELFERRQDGWIPRTTYHWGGRDFDRDLTIGDFYVKLYESLDEVRMHVIRKPGQPRWNPSSYRVVRTGIMEPTILSLRIRSYDQLIPIRSRRFGWRIKYWKPYTLPVSFTHAGYETCAKWAVAIQGWDWGAVDILTLTNGNPMVLEANSCPGLKDANTLKVYVDGIHALREETYGASVGFMG